MTAVAESGRRRREKRDFFDRLAPGWHRENPLTPRARDLLLSALPPGVLDRPGPVLDLGGGTGRLAEFFRGITASPLLVFDLSRRMLKETPAVFVHRLQGDAHHLPLRDRTIRLVFCFSAFPHFEQKREVVRECQRILLPGGFLVILHDCSREEINLFHSAQSPVIAGDHLPPLESFRQWGEMTGMIPERLEDGRERFLVWYRKPLA
jgi:ubiquinone/menaquinone biosynthesis C-methylase UbiE